MQWAHPWSAVCWCCCFAVLTLLASHPARADEAGFCLQGARNLPPSTEPDVLRQGGRSMPPAHPPLGAHDWPLSRPANQQQATTSYSPCHAEAPIFRFKVLRGVLYVDHDHHSDARYKTYRMAFLEQLVLSMWLYKDFPDADLVVDFSDHPQLCDQDLPFLRYSILNTTLLGQRGQHYNVTELLAPAWVTQQYAARVTRHTRGFTIPSPEAWRDLSLTPAQLADFTSCMDTTHPWASKAPRAFWRGQATGCSRGWPQLAGADAAAAAGQPSSTAAPAPHLLRNKRVQMALRLFPYGPGIADVGITSLPWLTPECLGPPAAAAARAAGQVGQQQQQQAAGSQPSGAGRRRRVRQRRRRPRQPGRHLSSAALQDARSSGRRPAAWRRQQEEQQLPQHAGQDGGSAAAQGAEQAGPSVAAGVPPVRAYRGVASLLHKEGIGLEGWADAALTLSIDGYGPPFRLPQQLLLGSAVLRMSSPYQTWLDWALVPGQHLREFAYDLTDLEQQLLAQLGLLAAGGKGDPRSSLQRMAEAARAVVVSRVHLVAQLDAFAWAVARYKEACPWEVTAAGGAWRVLQLGPDVFASKGVPEAVQRAVMRHLSTNFEAALQHPALQAG